jgi:transcriptional regulator with XRE-family HTH domain
MDIGRRLSEIRGVKGLSQGDIEKRSGLLRCYISRVENGHTIPSIETLERMAKALEIETYQLFLEGNKEPKAIPAESRAAPDTREYKLIETFRNLNAKDQGIVIALVRRLARAT